MPLFVFQTSGNPFVRLLVGLLSFAILVGLAFLMLPVLLVIIGVVLVIGLVVWGWVWYKSKLVDGSNDRFEDAMNRMSSRAQTNREPGYDAESGDVHEERAEMKILSVKTSDNKKWRMNDVEDIEEKK